MFLFVQLLIILYHQYARNVLLYVFCAYKLILKIAHNANQIIFYLTIHATRAVLLVLIQMYQINNVLPVIHHAGHALILQTVLHVIQGNFFTIGCATPIVPRLLSFIINIMEHVFNASRNAQLV